MRLGGAVLETWHGLGEATGEREGRLCWNRSVFNAGQPSRVGRCWSCPGSVEDHRNGLRRFSYREREGSQGLKEAIIDTEETCAGRRWKRPESIEDIHRGIGRQPLMGKGRVSHHLLLIRGSFVL